MAHRKRHRKSGHHRRRRHVGAIGMPKTGALIKLAGIAAGYFMGDTINTQVDKWLPTTKNTTTNVEEPNTWIGVVGEVGIGGLLLMRKKGKFKMATDLAGGVLVGAGIRRTLKATGVISGYQNVPVIGRRRVAGYQNVPVIGGLPAQLQGVPPAQLQGFRVNGYTSQGSGMAGSSGSGLMRTGSGYME